MKKLYCLAKSGASLASSRLRSYYLFEKHDDFGLEIIRPNRYAEALKGDLIHVQKIITVKSLLWLLVYRLFGKKIVYDIDDQPYSPKSFAAYYLSCLLATKITVDTEIRKKFWTQYFSACKICVIPDVADYKGENMKCQTRDTQLVDKKGMVWIGSSSNIDSLSSLIPSLSKLGLSLTVVTNLAEISDFMRSNVGIKFVQWNSNVLYEGGLNAKYMILNHFFDENSNYKSNNKMILSLMTGFIPIASSTPEYEKLAKKLGLDQFLFDDPTEIQQKIRGDGDLGIEQWEAIWSYLSKNYSKEAVLSKFLVDVAEFSICCESK